MSGSGNPSSSSSSSGGSGPCGACKFLRRKCVVGCIFAPYFDSEQGSVHFAAVHKVFGASNVSKLLQHVPEPKRPEAVVTICFEAQCRIRDPILGCVSHIVSLQQQVASLQTELSYTQAQLASLEMPQPQQPLVPVTTSPPPLCVSDLPVISTSSMYELSSIFEPLSASTWEMQHQSRPSDHIFGLPSNMGGGGGGSELQALARELIHGRRMNAQPPPTAGTSGSHALIKRE